MDYTEKFSFEDLIVWQKAMDFLDNVYDLTEDFYAIKGHYRLKEQLESCSSSIVLNIAEGRGRDTDKQFVQFLTFSRGSLYETVNLLIILKRRKFITEEDFRSLKNDSVELGKVLNAFISKIKRDIDADISS